MTGQTTVAIRGDVSSQFLSGPANKGRIKKQEKKFSVLLPANPLL